ncbi:MAG: hypothetical protein JSU70_19260 [Phycisphaerales bacterium]|nr:MAG: hypothetical protein JSU70_19260 [Phycisphaerales bacterium]
MSRRIEELVAICAVLALIGPVGTAHANWSETFDGNAFDLATWLFRGYPELTGTFSGTIQDGPDNDDYLTLDEASPAAIGGTQLGVGIGDPDDIFSDVRVGAVFNVSGDASRNYHGLAARISYFIDDGSMSGYPGIVANTYVLTIHYEEGPGNLKVELVKAANNQTGIMAEWQPEVPVPGLGHGGSRYFELDVVGSDPVYITGSVYEYEGGPLLVRTPTFVDTSANDPWEAPGIHDDVFASGSSGVFGMWESPQPAGYHSPFDSVSSISDGPAAVNPSPADGATGVSAANVNLSWVEAAFATSRELWLGKEGAMQKVDPAPSGTTYSPGTLEYGQTYQWRVDQVGASGTATGHTWSFTTGDCLTVDDFESYADDAAIEAAWPHSITGGYHYIFLETGQVRQGAKSMRFEYQNQYEPWLTEATLTFDSAQDWTANGVEALSLVFRGDDANVEQPISIKLEDATAGTDTVPHPYMYAVQSESWNDWDIDLQEFAGVDLTAVKKITIVIGNGTNSGQEVEDRDVLYIDHIKLCPARCFNVDQLDLSGDANGDCVVDYKDLATIADGWLNEGLMVP